MAGIASVLGNGGGNWHSGTGFGSVHSRFEGHIERGHQCRSVRRHQREGARTERDIAGGFANRLAEFGAIGQFGAERGLTAGPGCCCSAGEPDHAPGCHPRAPGERANQQSCAGFFDARAHRWSYRHGVRERGLRFHIRNTDDTGH